MQEMDMFSPYIFISATQQGPKLITLMVGTWPVSGFNFLITPFQTKNFYHSQKMFK